MPSKRFCLHSAVNLSGATPALLGLASHSFSFLLFPLSPASTSGSYCKEFSSRLWLLTHKTDIVQFMIISWSTLDVMLWYCLGQRGGMGKTFPSLSCLSLCTCHKSVVLLEIRAKIFRYRCTHTGVQLGQYVQHFMCVHWHLWGSTHRVQR